MGVVTTLPVQGSSSDGQTVALVDKTTTTGTIIRYCTSDATLNTITKDSHGFSNGDIVNFNATTFPTGIAATGFYYVINKTDNTFQISLTNGGAAIDFTGASSAMYICAYADPATDIISLKRHGLVNGDRVCLIATTVPTGLAATTIYYVVNATADTFQISTTLSGSAYNFTTTGQNLLVCKCEEIFSHVVNPDSMMTVYYEATCKQVGTTATRGYFYGDTCWTRVGSAVFNNQTLHSIALNRVNSSIFNILIGQNAGDNTAKIFVHGINETPIRWVGSVKYRVLEG